MKSGKIGLLVSGALLAIACGDTDGDAPPIRCDASASRCSNGGNAGLGGTSGASGQGGTSAASGRGGTGASGSAGTTGSDAGGQAGSSSVGSGGSAGGDAAADADASRKDASDAASDAGGRQCLEPAQLQDGGNCTLAVCRRGANVEISVSRPEGWYVGALLWVLTVCDIKFAQSRGPSNPTLIYDVPDADWARMRESDPVFVYYGTPSASGPGVLCGQLTKSIENCPP